MKDETMLHLENTEKPKRRGRTVLLSLLAVLLAGGGVGGLLYYLQREPEPLPARSFVLEADPEATAFLKATNPPTETPTEPPTEPITYEMQIDMEKVLEHAAVSEDVIGWVYIQDTPINYPVVQASDNDYYMDKNWKGQYSFAGSIFADYQCNIPLSQNSLLYGHNMGNGSMFHAVKYYRDEEWGKEHLFFEVATLNKRYLYKVISFNTLNGLAGADFEYWTCVNMMRDQFERFVQQIYDTSEVWYGDADYLPEYGKDRIITLQTCNSAANDGIRCVLFAECIGER